MQMSPLEGRPRRGRGGCLQDPGISQHGLVWTCEPEAATLPALVTRSSDNARSATELRSIFISSSSTHHAASPDCQGRAPRETAVVCDGRPIRCAFLASKPSVRWHFVLPGVVGSLPGRQWLHAMEVSSCSQKWEPLGYAHNEEDKIACGLYRQWAEQEWQCLEQETSVPISEYYRRGFFDGFMDYTYAGGKVSPPPVPPRDFWKTIFRTDEGDAAVQQWRDGFLRGAEVAQNKGYRRRALVPAFSQIEDHMNEGYSVASANANFDPAEDIDPNADPRSSTPRNGTGPDAPAWDGLSEPYPENPFRDDDPELLPDFESLRTPPQLPPRGEPVSPPPGPFTWDGTMPETGRTAEFAVGESPLTLVAEPQAQRLPADDAGMDEQAATAPRTFEVTDLDANQGAAPEANPGTPSGANVVPAAALIDLGDQFSAGDAGRDRAYGAAILEPSRSPVAGGHDYRGQMNPFRHPEQAPPTRPPNRYSAQFQNQSGPADPR